MLWFRIVELTGNRSIFEAKQSIGSSEFLQWSKYINQKYQERDKLEYYLAQLTAAIYIVNAPNPSKARSIKMEKFLFDFSPKKTKKYAKGLSQKARVAISQAAWFACAGPGVIVK